MNDKFTSPFATANTNADDVDALIRAGLELTRSDGSIDWQEFPANVRPFDQGGEGPIGYSRGWLIVRRAQVEQQNLTEKLPTHTDERLQTARREELIRKLRDDQQLSWGEIMVRTGLTEGQVRKLYRKDGTKKDLGTRIGKGGRFAYDDGTLYTDNRKREGAHIPVDKVGRPQVHELLNYIERDEAKQAGHGDARKQAWAKGTITKLLRKANDPACPQGERDAIMAKVAELRVKYGLSDAA